MEKSDIIKDVEIVDQEIQLKKAIRNQVSKTSDEKKNYYSLTSDKVDLKLQIERGKNLMDMRRIATFYFEDGKVYATSSIVYANSLGLIARPVLKKKIDKAVIVDEINEIVYPNGDIAPLLVLDAYNVRTIKITNKVSDLLKKEYKDFQDSFDLLEKRFLAHRLANLGNDKWSIGIVLVLGVCIGFVLGKTIK